MRLAHKQDATKIWATQYRNPGSRGEVRVSPVASGLIVLGAFWFLVPKPPVGVTILSWVELLLLIALGVEAFICMDHGIRAMPVALL